MLLFNMCEAEKKLKPLTKIVFKPFFYFTRIFGNCSKSPYPTFPGPIAHQFLLPLVNKGQK